MVPGQLLWPATVVKHYFVWQIHCLAFHFGFECLIVVWLFGRSQFLWKRNHLTSVFNFRYPTLEANHSCVHIGIFEFGANLILTLSRVTRLQKEKQQTNKPEESWYKVEQNGNLTKCFLISWNQKLCI